MKPLPNNFRQILLSSDSCRQNKIWLAVGWKESDGYFVEYRWVGEYMKSRLEFQFEPGRDYSKAKSYDEDVWPKLKWLDNRKNAKSVSKTL